MDNSWFEQCLRDNLLGDDGTGEGADEACWLESDDDDVLDE